MIHTIKAFIFATLCTIPVLVLQHASAHVGNHPSIHDTIAGVVERLRETYTVDELRAMDADDAAELLTDDEREILGKHYLTFSVNVPVVVSVMQYGRLRDDMFWLDDQGWEETGLHIEVDSREFDVWQKSFDAGEVGLGVHSLDGRGEHYFVAVRAQEPADNAKLVISDVYPGQHSVALLEPGAQVYTDESDTIAAVPAELANSLLVRGVDDRKREAQVLGVFRTTDYPASAEPDHVVLTWSDDPQTTQTVQWRTSMDVGGGAVAYAPKGAGAFDPDSAAQVAAKTIQLVQPTLVNDPVIHRHTATLSNLRPGMTYAYAVGDGAGHWRAPAEFTTAPKETTPFTFIYMGDAQNGLDTWGELVHKSLAAEPDASFYVMAGDLVNRGAERDDWDHFFEKAEGIFDRKQLIPVPGNHEYQGGAPDFYLEQFTLPESEHLGELNYVIEYSNAIFIMLDSNLSPTLQDDWLEEQLANTDATWTFVVYHHPAYSSAPRRNNQGIRDYWTPLFDKYHVDVALQGHDHAYLRTYPMYDEERVDSPAEGTIYIVSVSGTKFYEQGEFDYTEFGMTNVSTYQVLDIRIDGNRLVYRSYDAAGELRDEFAIVKE